MYGSMSAEALEQQCERMLREAEFNRLKKALRADRDRPATSRWASTIAWELARAVSLLRKFFKASKNAD